MTGLSTPMNPFGEHHRHAAMNSGARHLKPKHAEPLQIPRAAPKKTVGAMLVVVAAIIAMVALWAPTFGASPVVAQRIDAEGNPGSRGAAVVPTLAPAAEGVGAVGSSDASAVTASETIAARRFAGSQLAANTGLTLTATARELLVGGKVDARGILSLGQYLGQVHLTVNDFPAVTTGAGAGEARRQILLTGLAGVPLGSGGMAQGTDAPDPTASDGAAASVEAWFEGLSSPVNVESVIRTPAGVLVTFAPGEPTSMLPSPPPSL